MPRFAYSGRDRAGQPVTAELEAPSRRDALRVAGLPQGIKIPP